MEDKLSCKFCEVEYDMLERIPRIFKQCGHCICTRCLKNVLSKGLELVCPIDDTAIEVKGMT